MILEEIKENLWKINNKVHLKKNKDEYKLIYPIKNSEGKYNWKNFLIGGRWSNLVTIIIFLFIISFLAWSYNHDVDTYRDFYETVMENPSSICGRTSGGYINFNELNFSELLVDANEPSVFIPSSNYD